MSKIIKKSCFEAISVITVLFTFIPGNVFRSCECELITHIASCKSLNDWFNAADLNETFFRIVWLAAVLIVFLTINIIYLKVYIKFFRKQINIKGEDYIISIECGDFFKAKNCKKVINFDECYTTTVGDRPEDINSASLCGQYLLANPISSMEELIQKANVKPMKSKSLFGKKTRYKPGTLVPRGYDLLMSFAQLDEGGSGRFFSIADYIECLFNLWGEIAKYYGQNDVCVPILGAGTTYFPDGRNPSTQELIDLMIWTYKMSPRKLKMPYKLRIICKEREVFLLYYKQKHIFCNEDIK